MKVGILSDTHGFLHPRIEPFFKEVDEIWHAGDIGNLETCLALEKMKPLRSVYGNIDGHDLRSGTADHLFFQAEKATVLMTHIGGYPGRYDRKARGLIMQHKPALFVCGHSHILKVMYDSAYKMLYINPGAAGKSGLHKSITAVRLVVEGTDFKNLEVLDIPR
ncbi:metallophosphoesterase family protein [Bacteroidota bacterium]